MSDIPTQEFTLRRLGSPVIRPSLLLGVIVGIVAVVLVVIFAIDSYFVVEPTEMAGVRRLGQVVTAKPLGPGLHFKLPFIDQVDRLQVSLDTFKLDRLTVNTIDNQPIAVTVGLTYRIPPQAVLPLLYEVGRPGNFDIRENFERIVADRTAKIFAQQNTTRISENRDQIVNALKSLLSNDLGTLYHIEVVDFQISGILYSDSFRASVEAAVKAKNEAVAAENTVNRIRFEAQQAVERANGEAEAKLKLADAERQSTILSAQGRAEGIRLEGEARAAVLRMNAEILKTTPLVVDLAKADRWNGALPLTLLEGTNSLPLLTLPSGEASEKK
ncbi:MAG: prohibitin family protein [Verrucomicrobia bacterium]|nr:prohibitin family protein [Verrucomicrobiota bacterium]